MKATSCPVVVLDDRFATVCGASNGCVVGLDHAGRVYPVAQPVSANADDDGPDGSAGRIAASWLPPGLVPLQTVVFGRKRVVALTTSGKVISWGGPSAASSADPSSFAATTQSTSPASLSCLSPLRFWSGEIPTSQAFHTGISLPTSLVRGGGSSPTHGVPWHIALNLDGGIGAGASD